jgi:ion channel
MQALLARYRRDRFGWLFVSLLLTLAVNPVVEAFARFNPIEAFLGVNLLAAILGAAEQRWIRRLAVLAVVFVAVRVLAVGLDVPGLLPASSFAWVIAIVLAIAATARHAFRARSIDAEHVFAALDAYLLAGLAFGVGYALLDRTLPDSFGAAAESDLSITRGIYFSFVTLATLGYGDIVPTSDIARGVVILEAVIGQFYLTVVIARLVSLYRTPGS